MFFGVALNVAVRGFQSLQQGLLRVVVEFAVVDVANGFDGKTAGFLSTFVSAHAVGDDGEAALAAKVLVGVRFPVEVGVLVVGALAPNVGQARGFDARLGSCVLYIHR